MKPEDMLAVMEQNKGVYPEYDALSDERKMFFANVNIYSGTAETYIDDDGRVAGVGGIRYMGTGEGWFLTMPKYRTQPRRLFTFVAEQFERTRNEKNLWRIFAESKISEVFLKHLGFKKQDGMHIWTEGD
jgi:hypothetical protein